MAMSSDHYIEQTRTVEITAADARRLLHALEPLCNFGSSGQDDLAPIPSLKGCRVGHTRAARQGAYALKRALGDER